MDVDVPDAIVGDPISDEEIEALLANLARTPLGVDPNEGFRIPVAGAQQKTALLFHKGKWEQPMGTPRTLASF